MANSRAGADSKEEPGDPIWSKSKKVLRNREDEGMPEGQGVNLKELTVNSLSNKINVAWYCVTTQSIK